MLKLLYSVQTDILYNNFNLSSSDEFIVLSPIFDYTQIRQLIKNRIVFTQAAKGEYFRNKDMIREIGISILDNIVDNKTEFLDNINNIELDNPVLDMINLKLAILQREYIEHILKRLINRKFIFYNNKDIIVEHIANFFEKNPENRFIIDLHSMIEFDELHTQSNSDIILLLTFNMANPFIINLMMKYPHENYISKLPMLQANPRKSPDNCSNLDIIIDSIEERIKEENKVNNIYLSLVSMNSILIEHTKIPYIKVLKQFIGYNKNQLGRYVQSILEYYNSSNIQNGGYYKKYLKYKEKYIRLLNSIKQY
jgi:hypothetical protein